MKRGYPDRRRLEAQCISCVTFVRSEQEVLDSPCWIMLINVVAMELLKSKMPPGERIIIWWELGRQGGEGASIYDVHEPKLWKFSTQLKGCVILTHSGSVVAGKFMEPIDLTSCMDFGVRGDGEKSKMLWTSHMEVPHPSR